MTNPIVTNNISIKNFIEMIENELKQQNASWMRIALAFSEAAEQYGTDSDAYKKILRATNFSGSKARKLVAIARDERLTAYQDAFASIHSWTTLYEVTTLTDEQITELVARACSNQNTKSRGNSVITHGLVNAVKRGDVVKEVDPYKVAFEIRIDENALKAREFGGDDYEKLIKLLREIQEVVSFVRVDDTERLEKAEASHWSQLEREARKARRKMLEQALKSYKAHSTAWKTWTAKPGALKNKYDRSMIEIWSDKAEVLKAFEADPDAVFKTLGYDAYSNSAIYTTATSALDKKQAKFLEKMNDPFCHAGRFDETEERVQESSNDDDLGDECDWFADLGTAA